jgi:hypothetical protein
MHCYISLISGVMVGLELEESEDYNYLIIELFIVQFIFEWEK